MAVNAWRFNSAPSFFIFLLFPFLLFPAAVVPCFFHPSFLFSVSYALFPPFHLIFRTGCFCAFFLFRAENENMWKMIVLLGHSGCFVPVMSFSLSYRRFRVFQFIRGSLPLAFCFVPVMSFSLSYRRFQSFQFIRGSLPLVLWRFSSAYSFICRKPV